MNGLTATWNYPTTIRFGPGRIAELPEACRGIGMRRPLIVTDPGLAALPMIGAAEAGCRIAGLQAAVFRDVRANPVGRNVEEGVAVFRAGGHDGVIAFGGGSALDAGKAIAFMSGQKRPIWDFEDVGDWWTRADAEAIAPVVAVPTTAGTGSEVGRSAVVLDEAARTKKIIFHPRMLPRLVIADPELTLGLPPAVTAATGMDAFAHAFEAFCASGFHPLADGIAMEAMRLVKEWLPRAVHDGRDLSARAHMMAAASMGATAFQKGLGAVHALSHPLGAVYDAHHGLLNAVLLPYVMAHNRPAIAERIARLARLLDLDGFDGMLAWLLTLRQDIGIPHTLRALGIGEDRADAVAEMATRDPSAAGNPLPLDAAALRRILLDAVAGRLPAG
jgi:alcohol dehydrogenase class IV